MNLLKSVKHVRVKLYNPETTAYRDRIVSNGGSITDTSLNAIDKFVLDCKNAAIWDKLIEIGPFTGTGLNAALVKLSFGGGGSGVLTNVNFVSGDYVETGAGGGLLGDGATKYLNTGFNLPSLPDNCHLSAYLRDDVSAAGSRSLLGALTGTEQYWLGSTAASSNVVTRLGQLATASLAQPLNKGFYTAVRESTNSLRLYRDGVLTIADSSAITHSKPNWPVLVFAFSSAGTPGAYLPGRLGFYSIGQVLTEAESLALHLAVKTLQANLNRSIN